MTARELRAHRERLGMTQYELAKALECSQPRIEALERGRYGRKKLIDPSREVPADVAAAVMKLRPVRRPLIRPTEQEQWVRDCIARQVCPICGRGGWKLLARHTQMVHGVGGRELREMAALPADASICAPDLAKARREAHAERLRTIASDGGKAAAAVIAGKRRTLGRGGKVGRAVANRRRSA